MAEAREEDKSPNDKLRVTKSERKKKEEKIDETRTLEDNSSVDATMRTNSGILRKIVGIHISTATGVT